MIKHPSLLIIIGLTILETVLYSVFGMNILEGVLDDKNLNSFAMFLVLFTLITYLAYFLGCKDGKGEIK